MKFSVNKPKKSPKTPIRINRKYSIIQPRLSPRGERFFSDERK